MKDIRVGIIGMGNMGCKYAAYFLSKQIPGATLVGVTRITKRQEEWARKQLPKELPILQTDQELLEQVEMDAVIIATPHYAHPEQVMMSLQKGIHVLCEKPAGVYTKQVRLMNEEAAQRSEERRGGKEGRL